MIRCLQRYLARRLGAEMVYGHLAAESVAAAIRDYEAER